MLVLHVLIAVVGPRKSLVAMRALYHNTMRNVLVIIECALGGKRADLALAAPIHSAVRLCVLLQLFSCNKAKVALRTLVFLACAPVRIELRDGRVALTTLVAVPWLCCGPTLGSGHVTGGCIWHCFFELRNTY